MYRPFTVTAMGIAAVILFTNANCHKANLSDLQDGNWVQAASIPEYPRAGAISFVIGNRAYVGLGLNEHVGGTGRLKDFWQFSLDSGWTQKADFMGAARSAAAAFSIGAFGYVGTGTEDESNAFNDFYQYDTLNDQWNAKASFPGIARWGAVGFALKGLGYIGAGYKVNWLNDFYQYDPGSDQWARTPGTAGNFSKRKGAVAFVNDDKAYVVTGSMSGGMAKDFWCYDPSQSVPWIRLDDIANSTGSTSDDNYGDIQREDASVFINNGKAYLTCGRNAGNKSTTWMYDFVAKRWTQRSSYPRVSRFAAVAFTIDGKSFLGTGNTGNNTTFDDFDQFVPDVPFNPNN